VIDKLKGHLRTGLHLFYRASFLNPRFLEMVSYADQQGFSLRLYNATSGEKEVGRYGSGLKQLIVSWPALQEVYGISNRGSIALSKMG